MPSSITTIDLRVSVRNVQTWRKEGNRPADLLAPSVASETLLQNHSASRSKSSKSRVLGIVLIASCPAVFENSIGFSVRWTCLSRPLLLLVNGAFRILSWVRRGPISEFPMPVWKAHQKRTPFPRDRQGDIGGLVERNPLEIHALPRDLINILSVIGPEKAELQSRAAGLCLRPPSADRRSRWSTAERKHPR